MNNTTDLPKKTMLQTAIIAALTKMVTIELGVTCSLTTTGDYSDVFKKLSTKERKEPFSVIKLSAIDIAQNNGIGILSSVRPDTLSTHNNSLFQLGARQRMLMNNDPKHLEPIHKNSDPQKIATMALDVKLVPVVFTFDFIYATNSFEDVLSMMSKWAFCYQKEYMNFELDFAGIHLPIKVRLGSSLSSPEKSERGQQAPYFIYEGQFEVDGAMTVDNERDYNIIPVIHSTGTDISIYEQET